MKHIIICGPDRLGKDTLIKGLCDYYHYNNIVIRHFSKPPKEIEDPWTFQDNTFLNEGKFVLYYQEIDNDPHQYYENILIWNRSYLGEYVWGTLYRKLDKKFISDYIKNYENKYIFHKHTYLIYLYASPEFCTQHEDGKSLGKKIDDKKKQLDLFEEVYNLSTIPNKIRISVEEKNQFRPKEDILNDVLNFINK